MAQQNFAAGVEMSMTTVINNYLRWFRLNKAKMALSRDWMIVDQKWRGAQPDRESVTGCSMSWTSVVKVLVDREVPSVLVGACNLSRSIT